jgi:hypothetical protein
MKISYYRKADRIRIIGINTEFSKVSRPIVDRLVLLWVMTYIGKTNTDAASIWNVLPNVLFEMACPTICWSTIRDCILIVSLSSLQLYVMIVHLLKYIVKYFFIHSHIYICTHVYAPIYLLNVWYGWPAWSAPASRIAIAFAD